MRSPKRLPYEDGFKKGFNKLKACHIKPFKSTVKKALNIKDSWYYQLCNGRETINIMQIKKIEEVFAEFGIKNPKNIWGKEEN